jgi:hypothetical protein
MEETSMAFSIKWFILALLWVTFTIPMAVGYIVGTIMKE